MSSATTTRSVLPRTRLVERVPQDMGGRVVVECGLLGDGVDEACAADVADLGEDSGHRVLRVVRKGARKAKIPLTPATVAALEESRTKWGRLRGERHGVQCPAEAGVFTMLCDGAGPAP